MSWYRTQSHWLQMMCIKHYRLFKNSNPTYPMSRRSHPNRRFTNTITHQTLPIWRQTQKSTTHLRLHIGFANYNPKHTLLSCSTNAGDCYLSRRLASSIEHLAHTHTSGPFSGRRLALIRQWPLSNQRMIDIVMRIVNKPAGMRPCPTIVSAGLSLVCDSRDCPAMPKLLFGFKWKLCRFNWSCEKSVMVDPSCVWGVWKKFEM